MVTITAPGASDAGELFERARQQGYAALAITDECSLAGIVRELLQHMPPGDHAGAVDELRRAKAGDQGDQGSQG